MASGEAALRALIEAIAAGDTATALRLVAAAPEVARARVEEGATRAAAKEHWFESIAHYVYAGDTALHVAAAAYRHALARRLIASGADLRARNRRGAEPLHYAVDGGPGSRAWDPRAQAGTVALLVAAGADPNATDKGGVTPLHRAVRNRCADAVRALLDAGADAQRKNKSGSTPLDLATRTTGRGGTGTDEAKAEQARIVRLLEAHLPRR